MTSPSSVRAQIPLKHNPHFPAALRIAPTCAKCRCQLGAILEHRKRNASVCCGIVVVLVRKPAPAQFFRPHRCRARSAVGAAKHRVSSRRHSGTRNAAKNSAAASLAKVVFQCPRHFFHVRLLVVGSNPALNRTLRQRFFGGGVVGGVRALVAAQQGQLVAPQHRVALLFRKNRRASIHLTD